MGKGHDEAVVLARYYRVSWVLGYVLREISGEETNDWTMFWVGLQEMSG